MRRRIPATRPTHATKSALLDATVELLESTPVDQLTAEMVLARTGISRGSLYHHFDDFAHLVECALVARLTRDIDESIVVLEQAYATAETVDDVARLLDGVTRFTQRRDRAKRRTERLVAFAEAVDSERMRALLAAEQGRLTDAVTNVIAQAQGRGWIRAELDAHAIAAFIQAYTLGRVVDDIDPEPVSDDDWIQLVDHVVASFLNRS